MGFIERLDEQLKKKGIAKIKFAHDLGYSKNAYSEWKSGVTKSYMNKIDDIADYFDVSVDYLLGRTDNPSPIGEVFAAHFKDDKDFSDLSPEDQEAVRGVIAALRAKHKK